jgi:hypothetical protein
MIESEVFLRANVMPTRARKIALWLVSVTVGAILGYLLFNPLITLPVEVIFPFLRPALQFASVGFEDQYAKHIFRVASVAFVMNLPNTIFVGVVTALCLSWLQRRRQILYATFLWPLFLHVAHWLQVSLFELGVARLGLLNLVDFPVDPTFYFTSVLVVFTVPVFLLIALAFDWALKKQRHNPPLNMDAPASGAPAS